MALFARKYFAAAAMLAVSSVAGAQAAPAKPACDIGENATGNAARATLSLNLAREAASPASLLLSLIKGHCLPAQSWEKKHTG